MRRNRLTICGPFVLCLCLCAVVYGKTSAELLDVAEGKRDDKQLHDVKVTVERVDDRDYFRFSLQVGKTGISHFRWAKLAAEQDGNPILSLPVQTTSDERGVHIWFYMTRALATRSSFTLHFEKEPTIDNGPTAIYNVDLLSYLPKNPHRDRTSPRGEALPHHRTYGSQ